MFGFASEGNVCVPWFSVIEGYRHRQSQRVSYDIMFSYSSPYLHTSAAPHLLTLPPLSSKFVQINKTKCITYTAPHLRLTLPVLRPRHVLTAVPYPRQSVPLVQPSALHGLHSPTNSHQTSLNPGLIPPHHFHAPQLLLLPLPSAASHLETPSPTPSPSHLSRRRHVPNHSPANPAAGMHPQFSPLNVSSHC